MEGMTAVKKLINDPQTVVAESLEGFAAAHADVVAVDADASSSPLTSTPAS